MRTTLFVLAATLVAPTSPAARARLRVPAEPASPLPPEVRAIVDAVPSEQTPPERQHYVVSNEQRFDLVAPHLDARGGALVGVARDRAAP